MGHDFLLADERCGGGEGGGILGQIARAVKARAAGPRRCYGPTWYFLIAA
jgi:hypothetical protein